MTVIRYPRPQERGPQEYAPKRNIAMNLVEDLRALETEVSRKLAEGASDRQRNETQSKSDPAGDLNALIGRVSNSSAQEIDRVISALLGLKDELQRENERLSREIARYASLNHAVMSGMKVITDNLAQWRAP